METTIKVAPLERDKWLAERNRVYAMLLGFVPLEQDKMRAMRWPEYGKPETIPLSDVPAFGFYTDVYGVLEDGHVVLDGIGPAWTTSDSHWTCWEDPEKEKGALPLYPTRLDAAKALRIEVTEYISEALAKLDRFIEKEQANGGEGYPRTRSA